MNFGNRHRLGLIAGLILTLITLQDALAQDDLPAADENNVWYHYNESDTVFIFVHGLLSDSRGAWAHEDGEASGESTNWPRLLLEDPKFDNPSIFLGGFYTEFDSSDYGIRDAAIKLHQELAISVDPADEAVLDKPNIIFITHSTGGIVVRHMLVRNAETFADKKIGLVLIASPSIGSRDAERLDFIAALAEHKLGKELQWNNPFLDELDKDFKNLVNSREIPGLVGTEWLEHHLLYAKWIGIARKAVLVEPESAGRYFGEPILLPDTDHISAVKPNNRRHPAYRRLRYFYEQEFLPAESPAKDRAESSGVQITDNQGIAIGGAVNTGGGDIVVGNVAPTDKAVTATSRGVEFMLEGCMPNGAAITCSMTALSTSGDTKLLIKGLSRHGYFTDVQSTLFDQQGHEYLLSEVQIADLVYEPKYRKGLSMVNRKEGHGISKQMIEGVPTSISISFKEASPAVESIARLTIGGAIDEEPFTVTFPAMELSRR